jgi:hypothetical protein
MVGQKYNKCLKGTQLITYSSLFGSLASSEGYEAKCTGVQLRARY